MSRKDRITLCPHAGNRGERSQKKLASETGCPSCFSSKGEKYSQKKWEGEGERNLGKAPIWIEGFSETKCRQDGGLGWLRMIERRKRNLSKRAEEYEEGKKWKQNGDLSGPASAYRGGRTSRKARGFGKKGSGRRRTHPAYRNDGVELR